MNHYYELLKILDEKDYVLLRQTLLQLSKKSEPDHAVKYNGTSPVAVFKERFPWLLMLMVSAVFTARILAVFEAAIAAQTAFVLFIPMLMGAGGNAGIQASVAVVRDLSVHRLGGRDYWSILWKEIRVAFLCGVTLSAIHFLKIILIDNLLFESAIPMPVNLIVNVTLLLSILLSKIVGCSLPFVSVRLGFDPAVTAGPFVTTIVDIAILLLYFALVNNFTSIF